MKTRRETLVSPASSEQSGIASRYELCLGGREKTGGKASRDTRPYTEVGVGCVRMVDCVGNAVMNRADKDEEVSDAAEEEKQVAVGLRDEDRQTSEP
jgi:hypothetical protein